MPLSVFLEVASERRLSVGVCIQYELAGQLHDAKLLRLTFDGLLALGADGPPVGARTSIVLLDCQATRRLHLPATVTWTRTSAFAAEWEPLSPKQKQALDVFVLLFSRAVLGIDEREEEPLS